MRTRIAALVLALAVGACTDEVPLGSWGLGTSGAGAGGAAAGSGGTGGGGTSSAGTAGTDPSEAGAPPTECLAAGVPGPRNPPGLAPGTTNTNTDWFWPAPSDSIEFELMIEKENVTDGYFWAHQFGFVQAAGGFFGLQANGGFRADPPDGPLEFGGMLLFWISGPPIDAELGDIAYPDARAYLETERELLWWNINAKYSLRTCVTYRLRVGRESTDIPSGNTWYGAWILDTESGEETFVGRILVPAVWGQLSSFSTEWASRIDFVPPQTCEEAEPSSIFYRTPTANGGVMRPTSHINRFDAPARCATSRFTELPGGVRHEVGLDPP